MGLFGRNRKALEAAQQQLNEARTENQRLAAALAGIGETHAAEIADRDLLVVERDALASEVADLRRVAETAATEAALADADTDADAGAATRTRTGNEGVGGAWALLLGNLERRWVAAVGVQPEDRGLKSTTLTEQLVESLEREIERVREEVGVDVSFTVTEANEPEQPVVFLLAALDLLGAVVFTCERVRLDLDGDLLLVGETWTELGDEIETARTRAISAGAAVDEIDLADDHLRITLHP